MTNLILDYPFDKPDPLIDIILNNIKKAASEEVKRAYVGASSIGEECELKLWLRLNFPDRAAEREAKLVMAANDGHRGEVLAAEYLSQVPGVSLLTHNSLGKQFGFSLYEGKYKGHADGIITGIPLAPGTPHIWENKVCSLEKFNKLKALIFKYGVKDALKNWNYTYYCQAIALMHNMNFSRHYTTVWAAGMRDLITLRTNNDPLLGKLLNEKALRIINATHPPVGVSTNPSYYLCKENFCEFSATCPSINRCPVI